MTDSDKGLPIVLELFDVRTEAPKPEREKVGPVYQGVRKTIRRLQESDDFDKRLHAATIAQACSLARSVDRVSGHYGRQASGMQLSALHHELAELMARIMPAGPQNDEWQEFLNDLGKVPGIDDPTAPHRSVG